MSRIEYPKEWSKELIDSLERKTGWKPYYVPPCIAGYDTFHTVMLEAWTCQHLRLLTVFDILLWHDGKSPITRTSSDMMLAFRGLCWAMQRQAEDLDDIEHFMRETRDQLTVGDEPDPNGEEESNNIITLPAQS